MANYNDRTLEHLKGTGTHSTNMQIAAELLALPSRGGHTLKEISEKAEISERQLRNWRNDPRFQRLVETKTKNFVRERMPDVLNTVLDAAINDRSGKHAELLMKMQGMFTEKHEVVAIQDQRNRHDVTDFDRMNEEIEREIAELKQQIGDEEDE
ncbi:phBC6A51 family helix-turn-helix protein [Oceanobacillus longus]|uniref:PhBC6A51 family helix-turn-helix protein n=1 Tax=Oceanobacillus longus TaxID=930120 RepID=A0ABV8GVX2_9BACI